ncbi:hypothetical protein CYLTODRAFT_442612 [Cylindrobasidium torrendii FP15055 ss-10]|uniref:BTB domain-containing protein n=1 Tax=Cylindrobasidium torrendii FP15055 ss-10 TaxID=1314674 RepID=A0A0D7BGG9_9AGAR|nr:hypothetical protein CYLTODRAFT_442612 [Cylindrobasidium torrendii FP15055 ss-10]
MAAASAALVVSPPGLQEATNNSTTTWQADLESLFHRSKDRFPDVVWEVGVDENTEEVWGHKAIVYSRAPPSFQTRYFNFRPNTAPSPLGYASPVPTTSALSLSLGIDAPDSRSSSPMRVASPSPSNTGNPLRLQVAINPALFSNELEYLYTGQGFGEAFEFLFDSSETRQDGDAEELRIDKLRKDLVYMWRSRLYSDVRIELTGTFSSSNPEHTTAIFSSHRFILISRSSYFQTALVTWPNPKAPTSGEPLTLTLPSPPFTPASLHFTLGFIYTGTLVFSHRSYDLDTAFHIMRSATYLSLQSLYDEIQARIVQEMMHGLFHAFLEFSEYERVTGGKWGTGGCRCRQCARRAPRVLEFAISDDVKNAHLDRGARRALVGLFGEGWCTREFSELPQKLKDNLIKGVGKRTTPVNVFGLLFAAEHALAKMTNAIDAWADNARDYILQGRKTIDSVLASNAEACFTQPEWLEVMESDGVRFEDGERVEWIMASLKRGLTDKTAALVYQTLVSSIILRPNPTDPNQAMLSPTSHVRIQVENTREDILQYIKKRWIGVRHEGGFDDIEGWAVKEISDHTEVALEELLRPAPGKASHAASTKDNESVGDMQSMRPSVLNRHLNRTNNSNGNGIASSAASVRSARSTASRATTASTSMSSNRPRKHLDSRPDSKLTPSGGTIGRRTPTPSVHEPLPEEEETSYTDVSMEDPVEEPTTEQRTTPGRPLAKKIVDSSRPTSIASRRSVTRSVASSAASAASRPRSSLSMSSVASTSTVRRNLKAPASTVSSVSSRPSSRVSTATGTSETTSVYKTATTASRSRTSSSASNVSTSSSRTNNATSSKASPPPPLPAKKSPSIASSVTSPKKAPSLSPSVRSTVSSRTTPSPAKKPTPVVKPLSIPEKKKPVPVPTVSKPTRTQALAEHKKTESVASTSSSNSTSTLTGKRKGSSDTIRMDAKGKAPSRLSGPRNTPMSLDGLPTPSHAQGATLDIGIPCIISSRRKRFRAYARYIGEVEGEQGPWVGVEVPGTYSGNDIGEWNDGSWGGVRYFDIRGAPENWDEFGGYGNSWVTKGTKRSATDGLSGGRKRMRMRSGSPSGSESETDMGAESRGLFVRPQQVLYVVDAIDGDL